MSMSTEELNNRFSYHKPVGDQGERYEQIRRLARIFAECIVTLCPDSRESALAMTHLEESVMWANASIARRDDICDEFPGDSQIDLGDFIKSLLLTSGPETLKYIESCLDLKPNTLLNPRKG